MEAETDISPVRDLNAAIECCNPFAGRSSVTDAEIWRDSFADFIAPNDRATDIIMQAIDRVNSEISLVESGLVLAPRGMGKSHFLRRIRQCIYDRHGFFIYINAQQFTDSNLIRQQFLYAIAQSFRHRGSQRVMQWQQLAALLVHRALESSNSSDRFTVREWIKKFKNNSLTKNRTWVDRLTDAIFKANSNVEDPDLIRAIVWTLVSDRAPYAIKWLAGKPLSSVHLEEMSLPPHRSDNRESLAWEMMLQLLATVTDLAPVTMAFDRLEIDTINEPVIKKEQVIASLIKYVTDNLKSTGSRYGTLLLTATTPETWQEKLAPFTKNLSYYITGNRPILELKPRDRDTVADIISTWLRSHYSHRQLTPPTPLYPFDRSQLQALAREELNLQEIIQWCADNFKPVERDPLEPIARTFDSILTQTLEIDLENNQQLAAAIAFSISLLSGQTVNNIAIDGVCETILPKTANHGYIQFIVEGTQDDRSVRIGVAVVQEMHFAKVSAALKRLSDYETFSLTRGCLVRSAYRHIRPTWQGYDRLQHLTKDRHGAWINLTLEAIAPLVALKLLSDRHQDYNVDADSIATFAIQNRIVADNAIVRDILK